MAQKIRYFDIKVDMNTVPLGVKPLLKSINPSWDVEEMNTQFLHGGYLNKTILCKPDDKSDISNWLVVRVFAEENEFDRDTEVMGLQIAHAAKCGTRVLAFFCNGVVVGYFPGLNITYDDYLNHKVMRDINLALGRFHGIDIDNLTLFNAKGLVSTFDKTNRFKDSIERFISAIPEKYQKYSNQTRFEKTFKSKENIKKECEFFYETLHEINFPVSLCHLDFHNRNIMYDHSTGEVTFVDFEFCSYSYEAIDCTLPFIMKTVMVETGFWAEDAQPISNSDKEMWCLWYLEGKASVQGRDPASITNYEVEKYTAEVNIMSIINLFHRALLIISLAANENVASLGLDVMKYGTSLHGKYMEQKEKLIELVKLYKIKYGA